MDDRFVEACQMHCPIEYMADVLTVGDLEERVALVDELMKEGENYFSARVHHTKEKGGGAPWRRTGKRLI